MANNATAQQEASSMANLYVFAYETSEGLGLRVEESYSLAKAGRLYFAKHNCPTSTVVTVPAELADAPLFRETVLALIKAGRVMHASPSQIDENK